MEGLIPFVYRAIVQYKSGNQGPLTAWLPESPSASYMRLPGDSGRFQASDLQFLTTSSSSPSRGHASNTQVVVSSGVQTPLCRLTTTQRVAAWSIYPIGKPTGKRCSLILYLCSRKNLWITWSSMLSWFFYPSNINKRVKNQRGHMLFTLSSYMYQKKNVMVLVENQACV